MLWAMTMSRKVDLAEQLQKEFEDLLTEKEQRQFAKRNKKINEELIEKRPKSKKQVRAIIEKHTIDNDSSVKMFTTLNGVVNKLLNTPTRQSRNKLKPLDTIMRAYNVNNPKTFAKNVYNMTSGLQQSERNKRFRPALLSYYDGFTETIETEKQQAQRALLRADLERSSGIFKDFENLRQERVPIRQVKKQLIEKYGDPNRVKRALNTELHEQAERVKLEQSKFLGYTHKKWNTQKDERVRKTKFHNQVAGKIVPVDSNFRAAGMEAEYPSDLSLPVQERINCRCFVTYQNERDGKISSSPMILPTTIPAPIPPLSPKRKTIYKAGKDLNTSASTFEKTFPKAKVVGIFKLAINEQVAKNTIDNYGSFMGQYKKVFENSNLELNNDKILSKKVDAAYYHGHNLNTPNTPLGIRKEKTNKIVLNDLYYGSGANIEVQKARDIKSAKDGWHMTVPEDKVLDYSSQHEFGHYIHMEILTKQHYGKLPRAQYRLNLVDKNYVRFNDTSQGVRYRNNGFKAAIANTEKHFDESAKFYIDQALDRVANVQGWDKKDNEKRVKTVEKYTSEYGLTSRIEAMAEHWASYTLNEKNKNPLSTALGEIIEDTLMELENE